MPDENPFQAPVADDDLHLCRLCGCDLQGSARRIGVCVWCVSENKYMSVDIPKPNYGKTDG